MYMPPHQLKLMYALNSILYVRAFRNSNIRTHMHGWQGTLHVNELVTSSRMANPYTKKPASWFTFYQTAAEVAYIVIYRFLFDSL